MWEEGGCRDTDANEEVKGNDDKKGGDLTWHNMI